MIGTSRSPDKKAGAPVEMLVFDGIQPSPELREAISGATSLICGPAGATRCWPRSDIATPKLQSIVYLSSLGVYGDHGGAWIDETAPTIPPHTRGGARRRRAGLAGARPAAQHARSRSSGSAASTVRGRMRSCSRARAHRIDKPGHVSNRIHVADIAQAIDAAFARRFDGIVNVTDGEPAPPGDQIELAGAAGVAPQRRFASKRPNGCRRSC